MWGRVEKWRCVGNWIHRPSPWVWGCTQQRLLHEGPDTVEELLDRHLVKNKNDELENRRQLTSTQREALSLYRDIIRATRFFMWPDSRGILWRDVLRENARTEFEQARFETDPEIVTRLLIGGREALHSAIDKLAEKHTQHIQKDHPSDSHQR
ncbi:Complex 1 LYR protein [Spatholobus suberectus]|nr:Complex 1 LYR protein [Spatholobus suberectus]